MVVYVIAGVLRDPEAAKDQILAAVIPENPDLFMKVIRKKKKKELKFIKF